VLVSNLLQLGLEEELMTFEVPDDFMRSLGENSGYVALVPIALMPLHGEQPAIGRMNHRIRATEETAVDEHSESTCVLGHNVSAEFSEATGELVLRVDTRATPRNTTRNGNEIVATTDGNKHLAGFRIGLNVYRPRLDPAFDD
jgi:hypothetical protein